MQPWQVSLGVDLGTTHTIAVLATPDGRDQPLLFDSSPLLPSAVYGGADRRLLVGRDALREGRLAPQRLEQHPKRRVDDGAILLGDEEFHVVDIFAALLRRVGEEAVRAAGSPSRVVLTHPATWAAPRRQVLAEAARAAGFGAVTLVPEPVAAAVYFTTVLRRPVPDGHALVVFDLGAGTFDTSVVARRPGGGWDVLGADGSDTLGGVDLDAAVVDWIGRPLAGRDPALWNRLIHSPDVEDRRRRQQLYDEARVAKEQLSRQPTATVRVPLFDTDVQLTREEFEHLARPLLEQAVALTAATLTRAGLRPDRIAGLFLVGGSSRIPLAATLLHQRLGVAPTLIEQPELVVAYGSLRSTADPAQPPPRPVAPMAGAPISGAPMPAAPMSGAPMSAAPMSAAPMSAAPMSAAPMSAAPMSGVPMSGAPMAGAQVGSPPPFPPVPPPGAPRTPGRRPLTLALAGALALVLLAAAGYAIRRQTDTGRADNQGSGLTGTGGGAGGGSSAPGKPGGGQQLTVSRVVWYAAAKFTFRTVTYQPPAGAGDGTLTADVTVENLSSYPFTRNVFATYRSGDGRTTKGRLADTGQIPAKTTNPGRFTFDLDPSEVGDLKAGTISIGEGTETPAVVPFAEQAQATTLEPREVLPAARRTVGRLQFDGLACTLSAALLEGDDRNDAHTQVKDGYRYVACRFDVRALGQVGYGGQDVGPPNFRLVPPDGTPLAPMNVSARALGQDEVWRDRWYWFEVPFPLRPGAYTLQLRYLGPSNKDAPSPANTVTAELSMA
ncbi:Hsp70 family protein [Dactylosporangium aurantiacum]|uniref:Hsp70 family protein n=1 Tax=Dactylosporangium aurantiacum TaxID=35754 RepID=UPI0024348D17|nr:Hsp70 family protein [Dactylosporangium aurantiacum]MDG6103840.1 Hsp70 family protein [Dactylosporangium aurantiacum]